MQNERYAKDYKYVAGLTPEKVDEYFEFVDFCRKTYERPTAPKASDVPVGDKTARALPEPSKKR